ncbi:DUF320 domain-containing protein [Actinomadura sp. DSM 109109]|nr:DUF320 domain-containing protein [Actinomadura lepetitiana]
MRIWSRNTGRAALVAASALAVGAAFTTAVPASAEQATFGGGWGGHGHGVDMTSAGNFGLANGTQVFAPISIPINVCGNAVAIAGLSRAKCKGGASVKSNHREAGSGYRTAGDWGGDGWGGHGGGDVDMTSAGNFGLLNGTQVFAPISIPIDVCGNSVAALGAAQAACKGGASVKRTGGGHDVKMKSAGNFGALNGTQAYVPIKAPINACGNAVSLLGLAEAGCKGGATVEEKGHKDTPPTLRTPKKKPYKPSKHRPAAKPKKLPSTMRSEGSRIANTGTSTAPNYRRADALPAVKGFVDGLRGAVPGVDVKPGQIGPKVPAGKDAPLTLGSPILR